MPIERVRAQYAYDLTDMPASFAGEARGGMVMEDEMVAYSAMPMMAMAACALALSNYGPVAHPGYCFDCDPSMSPARP